MESQNLYRVEKKDFERLEKLLTRSFAKDPLYCKLIPDADTRKRLMPELFQCDLEEMFATCEIFADSPDINGIMIVSDESEPYNPFQYYWTEVMAAIKTDEYLIKEDPSLKTFWNFIKGKDYLNSRWTDQLHQEERLHIIYLAVDPDMQHHGISAKLMDETIEYAKAHHLMISLETHNERNVAFYRHFGFKVFGIVERGFDLKQYCMIREVQ
ncbi:GNAT family N-acetyltransferase [Clostridium sp. MCC353]|uniref:GNAT family N-acetyltransferase n=1 Tax=Clostridium sp. MCC353 TaxID=2592646 RepID=UPI001C00E671|nr:GNAT family N-acetyltransferase [Clostridium sp. MCC353]MBT9779362.1 GNAT family N-acetyltransferase [Clostridium sp. MCC353]